MTLCEYPEEHPLIVPMSDNLPDFLNDNAGVVTGLAGAAVHRNITATNRNLTALRGELGKLQERVAQEQKKEARESLNRDMLFQVNQQVESIASENPSPDQYFELLRVSAEFRKLGFTSATFNSLQDKSYLSSVASAIDQTLKRLWDTFPDEVRSLITDVKEWNTLNAFGEAIALVDQQVPEHQQRLSSTKAQLADLEKRKPHFFSNKILSSLCVGTLVIGSMFGLLALNTFSESEKLFRRATPEEIESGWYSKEQTEIRFRKHEEAKAKEKTLTSIAVVFLGGAVVAFTFLMLNLDKKNKDNFAQTKEANRVIKYLENHIIWLRGQRDAFAGQLSDLKRIPPETIEYFQSEFVDHTDRFGQLDGVSEYLKQVCTALGTHVGKLPRFPEREAKGGRLARRS